jgi:hypothetical protein
VGEARRGVGERLEEGDRVSGTELDFLYAGIDEQEQVLAHLATPGGAEIAHRVPFEALSDEDTALALQVWLDYEARHGHGPPPEILADEMAREEPFPEALGDPEHWLGKVLEAHLRDLGGAALSKASRMGETDPEAALEYIESEARAIRLRAAPAAGVEQDHGIGGVLDWYARRLEQAHTGLTLGFPEMDTEVFAIVPSQLCTIAARTKRYKSWLMQKSAVETMLNGKRVTFAPLELTMDEFKMRVACMVAKVSWEKQHKRGLSTEELKAVEEAEHWMRSLDNPIHIVRPDPGQRNARFLARLAQENGSEALYVDQLDFMDRERGRGINEWSEYGRCALELRETAVETGLAIMMAVQFNRMAIVKKFADLGAEVIAHADKIPQASDTILASFATQKMKANNIIHYGPIESRNGNAPRAWEVVVDLDNQADFFLGEEHDLQKDEEDE